MALQGYDNWLKPDGYEVESDYDEDAYLAYINDQIDLAREKEMDDYLWH